MTDQELKDLVASLAIAHKETEAIVKALVISQQETAAQMAKTDAQMAKTGSLRFCGKNYI